MNVCIKLVHIDAKSPSAPPGLLGGGGTAGRESLGGAVTVVHTKSVRPTAIMMATKQAAVGQGRHAQHRLDARVAALCLGLLLVIAVRVSGVLLVVHLHSVVELISRALDLHTMPTSDA